MSATPADEPRHGQERTVRRFAWLPTFLDDGRVIWRRHYLVRQYWNEMEPEPWGSVARWETLERRAID